MKYPLEYRWLMAQGFNGFLPWCFFEPKELEAFRKEYQRETGNDFLPFARREDKDDVAGFELIENEVQSNVITVHLTWSKKLERPGFPTLRKSIDIFEWIKDIVIPETIDNMSEEDLFELLHH